MKKKLLSFILVLCMTLCALPAAGTSVFASTGVYGENITYTLDSQGLLTLTGTGAMYDYSYSNPSALNGSTEVKAVKIEKGITSIGAYAFCEMENLVSIDIPDSITSIGRSSFWGCSSLLEINIPASVESIQEDALGYCRGMGKITVDTNNPYYSSEDGVLFDKQKTTLIRFPTEKQMISYDVPSSVKTIGDRAFFWSSLVKITLPEGVEVIGDDAFGTSSRLADVNIPDSVSYIGYQAFSDCRNITYVSISENVQYIGEYAFSAMRGLQGIYVDDNNPNYSSQNGVLFNKDKTTLLCYPLGISGDSYEVPLSVTRIEHFAFSDGWGTIISPLKTFIIKEQKRIGTKLR